MHYKYNHLQQLIIMKNIKYIYVNNVKICDFEYFSWFFLIFNINTFYNLIITIETDAKEYINKLYTC
jgi:hypothetical protein